MLRLLLLGIRLNFHSFVGRVFPKAQTHPQLACGSPDWNRVSFHQLTYSNVASSTSTIEAAEYRVPDITLNNKDIIESKCNQCLMPQTMHIPFGSTKQRSAPHSQCSSNQRRHTLKHRMHRHQHPRKATHDYCQPLR